MKNFLALVSLATALVAGNAQATITQLDYYRLGENDPGAANGGAGNATTTDVSGNPTGGNDLNKNGAPTYSNSVGATAAAKTHSTLSMHFGGAGNYYQNGAASTTATDNFGVEGWFNPDSAAQAGLAYTGSTSNSGFGLFVYNGTYQGLYGGVALMDSGVAVAPGSWTYFALVKQNGTTSLYVDSATARPGTFTAVTNSAIPSTSIGANEGGGDAYSGLADQVRFFTFAPGAFNPATDLLISVPEPSSIVLGVFGLAGLALVARRKRA